MDQYDVMYAHFEEHYIYASDEYFQVWVSHNSRGWVLQNFPW